MMRELGPLYQSEMDFELLLQLTVRKLISLLPSMAAVKEEDLNKCMNAVKLLYQLTKDATREEFLRFLRRQGKRRILYSV